MNGLKEDASATDIERISTEAVEKAQKAVNEILSLPPEGLTMMDKDIQIQTADIWSLWNRIIPSDLIIPIDREKFLGIDFDPQKGQLQLTEETLGTETKHKNKKDHLVQIHTHPSYTIEKMTEKVLGMNMSQPSEEELRLQTIPIPYYGDVRDMIAKDSIYAEIIIGLPAVNAPVLLLLKTKQFRSSRISVILSTLKYAMTPFSAEALAKGVEELDLVIARNCGIAVFRGNISSVPPHQGNKLNRKY